MNRKRTQANPSGNSRTEVVEGVEKRRQLCAMRRMSKLSDQHGRSRILKAETETDDSTSNSEHDQPVCKCLQEHADNDDHRADDDRVFPSDLLDEPPQEELGEDTAEALSAVEDT